jgi:hypothetical protein
VNQHDWLHGTPEPEPPELTALAQSYYERTEAYDLTVCTGQMGHDGIMPRDYRELALINRNASAVLKDVQAQAERLGYTREQLREAMRRWIAYKPKEKE